MTDKSNMWSRIRNLTVSMLLVLSIIWFAHIFRSFFVESIVQYERDEYHSELSDTRYRLQLQLSIGQCCLAQDNGWAGGTSPGEDYWQSAEHKAHQPRTQWLYYSVPGYPPRLRDLKAALIYFEHWGDHRGKYERVIFPAWQQFALPAIPAAFRGYKKLRKPRAAFPVIPTPVTA